MNLYVAILCIGFLQVIHASPSPFISVPPYGMCDDDGRANINDTCKQDYDCVPGLQCKSGICKCRENTYEVVRDLGPRIGFKSFCQPAPQFNQMCKTVCANAMVCLNGRCRCPEGLRLHFNGNYCFQECADDDFFVMQEGICRKKCTENEIKIENECKPIVALGEKCDVSRQCNIGFSWCKEGVCTCKSGFAKQGNECVAKTFNCPIGTPLTDPDNNIVPCERKRVEDLSLFGGPVAQSQFVNNQPRSQGSSMIMPTGYYHQPGMKFEDDCPTTHKCLTYDNSYMSNTAQGYCCPKPSKKPTCPIGEPLAGVKCTFYMPYGGSSDNVCPQDTHQCIQVPKQDESICCPKPCSSHQDIYRDGKCHQMVQNGDKCKYDDQCSRHNGQCIEGVCQCPENAVAVKNGAPDAPKYCQLNCKLTEVAIGRRCLPRLKIGDKCVSDFACPQNGFCKKGICACRCGMQQYGNSFCAPKPICNPTGQMGPFTQPKPVENPTFCPTKIPGRSLAAQFKSMANIEGLKVVEKCLGNLYCSQNFGGPGNMGVCCPKPDPICPGGYRPSVNDRCNPRNPKGCPNGFCHRFFTPADHNSNEGFICCPYMGGIRRPMPQFQQFPQQPIGAPILDEPEDIEPLE